MEQVGARPCVRRRDFLRASALGLGGAFLPDMPPAPARRNRSGSASSVVWLWLGGGPPHLETFDPNPSAPSFFRSTVGCVRTVVPGLVLSALFPQLARVADRLAFVRSFGHACTDHETASRLVLAGISPERPDPPPSLGSVLAHGRGPSHLPAYVRLGGIVGDGAGGLGSAFDPLDEDSAIRVLRPAFDLGREAPRVRERYGPGLGERLLLARRLCEAGVGFVTIHHPGWDLHGDLVAGLRLLAPQVDRAVAAFVRDTVERGVDRAILLVITGEFGRTPRLNAHGGRDHWPALTPLALAGGGLAMGQVVGAATDCADAPRTTPLGPADLRATVCHALGIPSPAGVAGQPIAELL